MFGIENYLGFVLAAILLNLTPGTDTMYIITRSVSHGSAAGFYSVLGIISGILAHTVVAALGLSIILINSPLAFTIVKYIGASYLCYLGLKMLMSKQPSLLANHLPRSSPSVHVMPNGCFMINSTSSGLMVKFAIEAIFSSSKSRSSKASIGSTPRLSAISDKNKPSYSLLVADPR